jgi:hypothetical protein
MRFDFPVTLKDKDLDNQGLCLQFHSHPVFSKTGQSFPTVQPQEEQFFF